MCSLSFWVLGHGAEPGATRLDVSVMATSSAVADFGYLGFFLAPFPGCSSGNSFLFSPSSRLVEERGLEGRRGQAGTHGGVNEQMGRLWSPLHRHRGARVVPSGEKPLSCLLRLT